MAALRHKIDISIEEDDLARLQKITRSRTEPANWVERARILLVYRDTPSAHAVGEAIGVTHQTVLRCLRRAVRSALNRLTKNKKLIVSQTCCSHAPVAPIISHTEAPPYHYAALAFQNGSDIIGSYH